MVEYLHGCIFVFLSRCLIARMPRKFRLSVHRKNEFCKKRVEKSITQQDAEPVSPMLMISIPKEAFYNASAPSLSQLNERVEILPEGMNVNINDYLCVLLQITQ